MFGYLPKQCRYCSKLISNSAKVSGNLYDYCSVDHRNKHEQILEKFKQKKNPDPGKSGSGNIFTTKES